LWIEEKFIYIACGGNLFHKFDVRIEFTHFVKVVGITPEADFNLLLGAYPEKFDRRFVRVEIYFGGNIVFLQHCGKRREKVRGYFHIFSPEHPEGMGEYGYSRLEKVFKNSHEFTFCRFSIRLRFQQFRKLMYRAYFYFKGIEMFPFYDRNAADSAIDLDTPKYFGTRLFESLEIKFKAAYNSNRYIFEDVSV